MQLLCRSLWSFAWINHTRTLRTKLKKFRIPSASAELSGSSQDHGNSFHWTPHLLIVLPHHPSFLSSCFYVAVLTTVGNWADASCNNNLNSWKNIVIISRINERHCTNQSFQLCKIQRLSNSNVCTISKTIYLKNLYIILTFNNLKFKISSIEKLVSTNCKC